MSFANNLKNTRLTIGKTTVSNAPVSEVDDASLIKYDAWFV